MLLLVQLGKIFTDKEVGFKDYLKCLVGLSEHVDYFAINISSPNTKGLKIFMIRIFWSLF